MYTIGCEILTASCFYDNANFNLTISLWNINPSQRFACLSNLFYRGAFGALLFIDLDEDFSLMELKEVIERVRKRSGKEIPIFLIVNEQSFHASIEYEVLTQFIEKENLESFFFLPHQKDYILLELGKKVLKERGIEVCYKKNQPLSDKDRKEYTKFVKEYNMYINFLNRFNKCPVCGNMNHYNYLNRFFYSTDAESKKIKKELFRVLEKSKKLHKKDYHHIKFGIPCCNCFRKYFN
ncbi:MAG: hypothetical protein BAJALOKI1v1_100001 [Promethearchaeota archaeon]|nr:MAG: hypothetical protein BAJALOKI1v1_100001 [Candidatus Lokiarchaeota archaeon]